MKTNYFLMLCFVFALASVYPAAYAQAKKTKATSTKKLESDMLEKDAFNFLVIGDWGRNGEHNQKEVALALKQAAEIADPEFIISTGDNFYCCGVASIDDPQWNTSYENIYVGSALQIPWHPVLGNHDYHGKAQAEIDYTLKSRRWVMPSRYYTYVEKMDKETNIRFVYIDTSPYVKKYHKESTAYDNIKNQDTIKQTKWIDSVLLATDQKDWKFVIGHHPIYSSSPKHGNTVELFGNVKPILEKNKVQAYFCGHDHDLQHQKPKDSYLDYFVSGAGSEIRKTAKAEYTLCAKSLAGFALVSVKGNKMTFYFIDKDLNIAYSYIRTK